MILNYINENERIAVLFMRLVSFFDRFVFYNYILTISLKIN